MATARPADDRSVELKRVAVFGACDGLGIVLGLIAGMIVSHQPAHAVWAAAMKNDATPEQLLMFARWIQERFG